MARLTPTQHDVLDNINSFADRLRDWIAENPGAVIGGAALVLLAAGGMSGWRWWHARQEDRAAAALAKLQDGYRAAMGAVPAAVEISEPANPETARAARRDAATQLLALAESERGTQAALLARISAADRLMELGDVSKAAEELRAALDPIRPGDPRRGVMLERIAFAEESLGRWQEAAEAYAEAASLGSYPLRAWAKAEAARSWAQAGELDRAGALAQELAADPEGMQSLPPHLVAELAEIRARAPAAPSTP